MGKDLTLTISLEETLEHTYNPGKEISGHVLIETAERIKTKGVLLEFVGMVRTKWNEGAGRSRRSYFGFQHLVNLKMFLQGSENRSHYIDAGLHRIPFSVPLDYDLPSSFEGQLGFIRYHLKAIIDRPMRLNETNLILIKVIRPVNLNYEPSRLREPVALLNQTPETGFCYKCCCVGGFPEMDISVNRGCFVPGETILVSGRVTNRSDARINRIIISFIMTTFYSATNKNGEKYRTTSMDSVIATAERPGLAKGQEDAWDAVAFIVPPLPASRLDGCKIISLSYNIQAKAQFLKCFAESKVRQEVTIGNIPLHNNYYDIGVITVQPHGQPPPFASLSFPPEVEASALPQKVGLGISNAGFDASEDDEAELEHQPSNDNAQEIQLDEPPREQD